LHVVGPAVQVIVADSLPAAGSVGMPQAAWQGPVIIPSADAASHVYVAATKHDFARVLYPGPFHRRRRRLSAMTETTTAAASTLGVTHAQFLKLLGNAQFPRPLTNDGYGNMTFTPSDITAFAATMSAAKANGWIVGDNQLASANWTMMASTPTGQGYRGNSDPLWDL